MVSSPRLQRINAFLRYFPFLFSLMTPFSPIHGEILVLRVKNLMLTPAFAVQFLRSRILSKYASGPRKLRVRRMDPHQLHPAWATSPTLLVRIEFARTKGLEGWIAFAYWVRGGRVVRTTLIPFRFPLTWRIFQTCKATSNSLRTTRTSPFRRALHSCF